MGLGEKQVWAALAGLKDPSGMALDDSPLLSGIDIRQGQVTVVLDAGAASIEALAPLRAEIEKRVQALAGVELALVMLTAERSPAPRPERLLPQVKRVIAVASGKGGVGKSTTAANLALCFATRGMSVGLLDADIYGPSVPHLFGLKEPPQNEAGKIIPLSAHGISIISIGLMVARDMPLIWRGPMIDKVITQFLRDVDWGALDLLVVDTPPGTGDALITLTKRLALDGAVIVSTPQDLALIDTRKGIELFRKAGVPVLGVIENMSVFVCPACGMRHDIFAHGGAREEAQNQDVAFLGEIPLHISIRETSETGTPLVGSAPHSAQAQAYFAIADKILDRLALSLALSPADAAVVKS